MNSRAAALLLVATAALTALAALAGCGGTATPADGGLATATPARTIDIELRDVAFSVTRIEVRADEVIDLDLRNSAAADHDFTIERMPVHALALGEQTTAHAAHASHLAVHAAPGPGHATTLRLHPHARGEYAFYCSVPGHREAGMSGTIVVG